MPSQGHERQGRKPGQGLLFPLCVRSVASNSVEGHHQGLGSRTFDGGPAPQRIERIEDLTIGDLLCEAARESGDRIALVDGVSDPKLRNRWTYTELLQQSERVAYALLTRFRPGDRIALCSPNCPEWIMLHYGIVLAGMVEVPIPARSRAAEIATVVKDCGASAFV